MTALLEPASPRAESARMAAVHRYDVLTGEPEPVFDRIAEAAALACGTARAAVDIVTEDRILVLAAAGFGAGQSAPREASLCAVAIEGERPLVVPDAQADPRFTANPLVAAGDVRFYAGVGLRTPDGHAIGTLCVFDTIPRSVGPAQLRQLEALAAVVVDSLELRLAARLNLEREAGLRRQAEELAEALQASLLPPRPPDLPEMEVASRYLAGEQGLLIGGDFFDVFRLAANDWGILLGDACGKGARPASLAALARWSIRAASVRQFSPSAVLCDVNRVFFDDTEAGDDRFCSAVFARLELDRCGAWLTVANCGHPRPILVRRSGKVELRSAPSLPVGLFPDVTPEDDRVGLGPGDALVLYTDGITEARADDGELFGEERLLDALRGLAGAPAGSLADAVVEAATAFASGRPADDVAVLVVRVPEDAGEDPIGRIEAATGVPAGELALPAYPKDTGPLR